MRKQAVKALKVSLLVFAALWLLAGCALLVYTSPKILIVFSAAAVLWGIIIRDLRNEDKALSAPRTATAPEKETIP